MHFLQRALRRRPSDRRNNYRRCKTRESYNNWDTPSDEFPFTQVTLERERARVLFGWSSGERGRPKGVMSAEAHAQKSPAETNLHTSHGGIFAFPSLQKLGSSILSMEGKKMNVILWRKYHIFELLVEDLVYRSCEGNYWNKIHGLAVMKISFRI